MRLAGTGGGWASQVVIGAANSNGDRQFKLLNAPRTYGYQAEITGLTHSTLTWISTLDNDDLWVKP